MHFAIIIRDKHHKNYVNVSTRFIEQLSQALANVHKAEVKAVKYYDKNSTAWTREFKPERMAFISEYAHFDMESLKNSAEMFKNEYPTEI